MAPRTDVGTEIFYHYVNANVPRTTEHAPAWPDTVALDVPRTVVPPSTVSGHHEPPPTLAPPGRSGGGGGGGGGETGTVRLQPVLLRRWDAQHWANTAPRDPLAALVLVLALAYLAYLTAASARSGNADYIFALARALTSARARAVVFEFPLIRRALARLGGSLTIAAAVATLPMTLLALVCVRAAGRIFVACTCFGALGIALIAALRGAAFFFATDAVLLALLLVCVAFVALILLYALYAGRDALYDYGRLFEDAAAIVFSALPGLVVATLVVGTLYAAFFVWWGLTTAALLTSDVGVLLAGAVDVAASSGADRPLAALAGDAAAAAATASASANGTRGSVVFVGGSSFNVYFCIALSFWVANILNGVMRVAVAGGARAWRMRGWASAGVLAGLARALTISLGSLALAAVLVSVVEWTHALVARSRTVLKRSCAGGPLLAPLKLALVVLRTVLRYVNSYIYVEIAESGCSFFEAGHRVCRRFRAAPGKAIGNYATTTYVLVALRAVVAGGAVLVAALVRAPIDATGTALPLVAALASRQAFSAYVVAYTVAALPTAWLETATHARLAHDADGEASEGEAAMQI